MLLTEKGVYKLCDFGSATTRTIQPGTVMGIQEIRMLEEEISKATTLQYRAPELCDLYQRKGISEKVDIWVCLLIYIDKSRRWVYSCISFAIL